MFSVDVGRCHCLSVLEPCKHMQPCKHIQRSHGSSLSFSAVLQTVELSRPLPFRAAPSLHFAMSVSAEEVAKHNKDGKVCLREPDVNSVMFWDGACRHVRRRTATAG